MADFKEVPADAPVAQKVTTWFENRFPSAFAAYRVHMSEYYAPKNFNFWYFFGSLAMLVLVIQIVTGIFLVMHYKPDAAQAFGGRPIGAAGRASAFRGGARREDAFDGASSAALLGEYTCCTSDPSLRAT